MAIPATAPGDNLEEVVHSSADVLVAEACMAVAPDERVTLVTVSVSVMVI